MKLRAANSRRGIKPDFENEHHRTEVSPCAVNFAAGY
jgi:hypothetical protein